MKPAVDEMFPEGAGPYVDLDEVRRAEEAARKGVKGVNGSPEAPETPGSRACRVPSRLGRSVPPGTA
jgi:hypothetical protein